ncbi:serine/threonine-protein kinase HipA [Parvibaculum indicum]|uniref:HipA domain-containing protein n=1 Tax=Parvibaculum indicum TaxID=562969 RepID=UPI0014235C8B|nr:HipA domain-containing protein [Parvibaculum indicum]NIJ41583.1 serine/threonine-protein kinase HipA [Parvibaculum indicum]
MTREIDVFVEGEDRPTGRLSGDEQGALSFRYTADAVRPVSLALPLERESLKDSETRSFFDNLLQENSSLDAVMAKHNIDRSDIAGLLYHLGRDCPGAISCVPAGEGPGKRPGRLEEDYDVLSDNDLARIMRSLRDDRRLPVDTKDPSPLAGVQGKIALTLLADGSFAIPRHGTGVPTTHILKIPRRGEEALVDQEHRLMSIAGRVYGDEVAHVEPLEIDDVRGLLITRFDRVVENGVVSRIHQEDFCQALGLPKSLKYERDGEGGRSFNAEAVGKVLGKTRLPAKARRSLLQMTILNLALGNTDNHAKNHALIYRGNAPELAPLYDVVPVLLDSNIDHRFSLHIGAADTMEALTRDDFFDFVRAIGLRARGRSGEDEILKNTGEVLNAIAGLVDELQGGQTKLLGDMIAHQVERISEVLGLETEIPERDAFLLRGGGFRLQS